MDQEQTCGRQVIIIGAGPAGLTAAYELAKLDDNPMVIEKGDKVGGIARTEDYKGYYFDMGGHRFYIPARVIGLKPLSDYPRDKKPTLYNYLRFYL